jgi:hypothetical protein
VTLIDGITTYQSDAHALEFCLCAHRKYLSIESKSRRVDAGIGGTEKGCLIMINRLRYYLLLVLQLASFDDIGRARRGASGTLYSQSAIARLNSSPRIDTVEPLPP